MKLYSPLVHTIELQRTFLKVCRPAKFVKANVSLVNQVDSTRFAVLNSPPRLNQMNFHRHFSLFVFEFYSKNCNFFCLNQKLQCSKFAKKNAISRIEENRLKDVYTIHYTGPLKSIRF